MTNIIKALKSTNNCFDKIQIQKYSSHSVFMIIHQRAISKLSKYLALNTCIYVVK